MGICVTVIFRNALGGIWEIQYKTRDNFGAPIELRSGNLPNTYQKLCRSSQLAEDDEDEWLKERRNKNEMNNKRRRS
jgi:hypothetical protein